MTDLENVRHYILQKMHEQSDLAFQEQGIEHTLMVVSFIAYFAKLEKLDQEKAMVAAYFHDLAFYTTHYHLDHAKRSATMAMDMLPKLTHYSADEIALITQAIARHSQKQMIADPFCELLKDSDVYAHYLEMGYENLNDIEKQRFDRRCF